MHRMISNKVNMPHPQVHHTYHVLDASENVGVKTTGALSPQDLRGVIKEYIIEQNQNAEEENFAVDTLSSPSTVSIAASWNNNFNKNVTSILELREDDQSGSFLSRC